MSACESLKGSTVFSEGSYDNSHGETLLPERGSNGAASSFGTGPGAVKVPELAKANSQSMYLKQKSRQRTHLRGGDAACRELGREGVSGWARRT